MSIHKLVVIDLSSANTTLFENYERKVISLLSQYGGRLELSVRSTDGATETHVLTFPDAVRFEAFLLNPIRVALKDDWVRTGVESSITDVEKIDYV